MAVGFSGSNGGITSNIRKISGQERSLIKTALTQRLITKVCKTLQLKTEEFLACFSFPMEVSYFLNNTCNLSCRHCYVGTTEGKNRLTVPEWQDLFGECMALGALTFGNVGKELTLVWRDTLELLQWFKEEKRSSPRLRYGVVTNGILLNDKRVFELADADPTYIDVSFDGSETVHDYIRRKGSYLKTITNLAKFPHELKKRVFISFTANALNLSTFPAMVEDLYRIGIHQFLISPYVSTEVGINEKWEELVVDDSAIVSFSKALLAGEILDWSKYESLRVYVKCDYTTSRGIMSKLEEAKVIKLDELMVDDYGVIFNQYQFGSNVLYFNHVPSDDSFLRSIRFSHDGYVSNCYDMFFRDEVYHQRAIGNVRQESIGDILCKIL